MGDFSANFHRPSTGVHTVEGTVSGVRAASLAKKRQAEQSAFEERKRQIRDDAERGKRTIDDKFAGDASLTKAERAFRDKTIGLVSAEDFRKAAEESKKAGGGGKWDEEEKGKGGELLTEEERKERVKAERKARKKRLKEKKKMMSTLSFAGADEDDDEIVDVNGGDDDGRPSESRKKDPTVDTSFLPDKEREQALHAERKKLEKEWKDAQSAVKNELLEITYSYWDGSGHRRIVHCQKGDTVAQFLELVRRDLAKEFREMGNVGSDALLYVKEDLIIPQDITFYDLIVTRARGKSGPLFNFDVHDDVRVGAVDSRVEKDESHPGKVVERRWYERNKHIFPASRWEVFDPRKDYGRYTIHGGEIHTKKKK